MITDLKELLPRLLYRWGDKIETQAEAPEVNKNELSPELWRYLCDTLPDWE